MIRLIAIFFCLQNILADCPLSNYPRQTTLGYIQSQLNNDPLLHNTKIDYSYPLQVPFSETKISVAIGLISFSLTAHSSISFNVEHMISSDRDKLNFKVIVIDSNYGWKNLRFSFLASQSYLFQMNSFQITQFSKGIEEGSFAIYRRIPNINNYSNQPILKVFLHGCKQEGKDLNNAQYRKLIQQFNNFNRFSTNTELINYFSQSVQQYQSLKVSIQDPGLLEDFLSFSLQTDGTLSSITFSYLLFSDKIFSQMHNQVNGDFTLVYDDRYEFTGLSNMEMVFAGLNSLKLPRENQYSFELSFENYLGRSIFSTQTTHSFLAQGLSFVALEIKHKYVCSDCENSPFIYQNFCLEKCPKSFSQVITKDNSYCQKCSIDEFKVIDPKTFQCVCARRFFRVNNDCSPCRYDCLTCQNQNTCLTCDNEEKQTKRMKNGGSCVCPSVGYFDDQDRQDIVCQKCHSSCRTCNGPYIHDCLTCQSDKEIDNFGHCRCKNGFSSTSRGKCFCLPPSIVINGQCVNTNSNCHENQTLITEGGYSKCVCRDEFITVLDQCVRCGENQQFNEQNLQCQCVNKTVRYEGRCVSCGVNQIFDEGLRVCRCDGNTFETQNPRECIACPPKMTYQNGKCQCIFNFYESKPNVCLKCTADTDGPKCRRIVI